MDLKGFMSLMKKKYKESQKQEDESEGPSIAEKINFGGRYPEKEKRSQAEMAKQMLLEKRKREQLRKSKK